MIFIEIPFWIKWLLFIGMIFYFIYNARNPIMAFCALENNHWQLLLHNGAQLTAELLDSSVITRYVMILNFRHTHHRKKYSLCVFPDSLPSSDLRRLRSSISMR